MLVFLTKYFLVLVRERVLKKIWHFTDQGLPHPSPYVLPTIEEIVIIAFLDVSRPFGRKWSDFF